MNVKKVIYDGGGSNYIEELCNYSPIAEKYVTKQIEEVTSPNFSFKELIKKANVEFCNFSKHYEIINEYYNSISEISKEDLNLILFDLLFINIEYSFWNCLINNGISEDLIVKEIELLGLNPIDTLSKLDQNLKCSIYADKYKETNKLNDINDESIKDIPEEVYSLYKSFLLIQKNISNFNVEKLFPLFKKVSDNLDIPAYAPEYYNQLKRYYDDIEAYNLSIGFVFMGQTLLDTKTGIAYQLDKKSSKLLNSIIKCKETIFLLSNIWPVFNELKDNGFIEKYNFNELLDLSYETREHTDKIKGMLYLELSYGCNLNCKYCYNRGENRGEPLTYEEYIKIIDKFAKDGCYNAVLFGGEPFLNKDIFKIIKYLNKIEFPVDIFTNATLLDDDIVKSLSNVSINLIKVSIDGKKDLHDSVRGEGSYDKAVKGLKLLNEYTNIRVRINATIQRTNSSTDSIESIFKLAKSTGVREIGFARLREMGNAIISDSKGLSIDEQILLQKEISIMSKKYNIEAGLDGYCEAQKKLWHDDIAFNNNLSSECVSYIKASLCSLGVAMYYVRSDGILVPCPEMADSPERGFDCRKRELPDKFPGNIFPKEISCLKYRTSECSKCGLFSFCLGSCRAEAERISGSLSGCNKISKEWYSKIMKNILNDEEQYNEG